MRPDLARVEIAPQFPSYWTSASFAGADAALQFSTDLTSTASLAVQLSQPTPELELRIPLRAGTLASLTVTGAPADATVQNTSESGFGQTVLVVRVSAGASGALVAGAAAQVTFSDALPCSPSVFANATEGAAVALSAPAGLALVNFSDPQGVLAGAALAGGVLSGTVAAGVSGNHLVFGYAVTSGGLPQTILFKLNVTAAAAAAPPLPGARALAAASSSWAFVPLGAAANGDLREIFKEDAYTSPRPETCAVRLGSDGWSAWTFPYWNGPWAPQADFTNVLNMTVPGGAIQTPQGAQFKLGSIAAGTQLNVAFTTLYDAYPNASSVPVSAAAAAGAATAWALVAGSTNPMQTRLVNAELRFRYSDGTADVLELVPPFNYWALSGWGNNDYDYATDAFCLPPTPPPTVQLGLHNRAMVYAHSLAAGKTLAAVELEAMSQEVVVGLLAVSLSS